MTYRSWILVMAAAAGTPGVTLADAATGSTLSKREAIVQIAGCMKKRMAADRLVSYNQAARDCKARVLGIGTAPAQGELVAADTPAKQ